ncbi:MAG: hypothetical protein AAGE84_13465 [Cyanobacteria bacterium P01_G01_bin.39]
MPIVGQDQRRVVDRFDVPGRITQAPLPSIVAIDSIFKDETRVAGPSIGTGVVISPNYVLTAAHNLFLKDPIVQYQTDIRVTSSNQQKNLDGRALGAISLLDTGNVDLQFDSFVFGSTNEGAEVISDFSIEEDTFVFVASNFPGIPNPGLVSSQMFTIGSSATTNAHRLIYNSGSGELFYDEDGVGSMAKVELAQLDSGLPLTNIDFLMV